MLGNYLIIAYRSFLKNKISYSINVIGLALGISGSLLLTTHIWDELTFDSFHNNKHQLYQVTRFFKKIGQRSSTSPPLASTMAENFPEIKSATRYYVRNGNVQVGTTAYSEKLYFVDPEFFDMFSFPLEVGEQKAILNTPDEVLITKKIAQKFFGDVSPLGKTLKIRSNDWSKDYDFTVAGILEDIPSNSSIKLSVVLPTKFLAKTNHAFRNGGYWKSIGANTFILLNHGTNLKELESKIGDLVNKNIPYKNSNEREYALLPLLDIHFADIQQLFIVHSKKSYIYILSGLALLIIVIASINSTSLSIGQSAKRTKEIGLRKSVGASRKQLIWQFLIESILTAFLAFLISIVLVILLLPAFNDILDKQLSFNIFNQPLFIILLFSLVLATGLLSGSYPALVLSKLSPDVNLRKQLTLLGNKQLITGLSTLQFIISSFLIILTFLMGKQLETIFSKNLGFKDDLVLKLDVPINRSNKLLEQYRDILNAETSILSVSGSWNRISSDKGVAYNQFEFLINDEKINGKVLTIDHELINTLHVKLKKGRQINPRDTTKHYRKVLLNERFVLEAGLIDPIGTIIEFPMGESLCMFTQAEVVGVLEDFHYESLHQTIAPLVITSSHYLLYSSLYVRLAHGNLKEQMGLLRDKWDLIAPDLPFTYTFMDEVIEAQYKAEQKWLDIGFYASFLAISIACMGMFGITVLSTSQRVKEIGIRKVLGASISSILLLLSKDHIKIVLLAYVIAVPLANYAISLWLEDFAYKVDIAWWYFLVTGIIVLLITILTVSTQSIKSALSNPVDCLRNE